ncbi:1-acyl-sn-glycerol-3-phosphate acyltransferases [Nocardioides scoriae]|uniref:1-acyl-sn-glycerol-3-phosphate acyltransferases n=1 Tax=Nocardioides scoriae TaxID=642780 RepID=A0A1H1TDV0_9ACTN|nr:lysophospholipid acyltransferase family protein [Nocardioides scoriae]SDS58221.1 1-acyl-sn-glycerol-3-phosphate acyltransferases [Nocardioides scoriae]
MSDPVYRLVNGVGRLALRALRLEVRWTGAEHLPTQGPVVLAATHGSFPDFVLLERVAVTRGRYVRFLTRHDVWHAPGVPFFMDAMRHVPVDRDAPAAAYLRARALLRAGEAVGGFPEAGISHSYTVRPLMRGLVALAQEVGVPLVPVALWGGQRLLGVGDPAPPPDWTRGRRVDLALGPALRVAPGDDLTERTHELGHVLTDLLEGLQRLPHHQPRPGQVAPWHPAHLGGHAPSRYRAVELETVPLHAVRPSWGPDLDAYGGPAGRTPPGPPAR